MSAVASIYILQQIDTKIYRSNERIQQIVTIIADKHVVEDAVARVDVAKEAMLILSKRLTVIQGEIDIVTNKYDSGEMRLYSGTVTNPKELKDLQDQGAALTRRRNELEDNKLEAMIAEEDCKETLEETIRQYDTVVDQSKKLEDELKLEHESLASVISTLTVEREVALNSVQKEVLVNYDYARSKYRGVAVVLVSNGMCSGCGLRVSTALVQAARGGKNMVKCDNCNRFLYVK